MAADRYSTSWSLSMGLLPCHQNLCALCNVMYSKSNVDAHCGIALAELTVGGFSQERMIHVEKEKLTSLAQSG